MFDWRKGEKDPVDFTTGTFADIYKGHINTLNMMKADHANKYHVMMADIYAKVR
jgi:hypothetical protein